MAAVMVWPLQKWSKTDFWSKSKLLLQNLHFLLSCGVFPDWSTSTCTHMLIHKRHSRWELVLYIFLPLTAFTPLCHYIKIFKYVFWTYGISSVVRGAMWMTAKTDLLTSHHHFIFNTHSVWYVYDTHRTMKRHHHWCPFVYMRLFQCAWVCVCSSFHFL